MHYKKSFINSSLALLLEWSKKSVGPCGDSMVYICHTCSKEVTPEGLKTLPGVKCPYCGGRILYKIRPPVVKRVKGV